MIHQNNESKILFSSVRLHTDHILYQNCDKKLLSSQSSKEVKGLILSQQEKKTVEDKR